MTDQQTHVFLTALGQGSTVVEASAAAQVSSATVYKLRKTDGDFAEAWRLALEDSLDILDVVARRRAVDGHEEPVVYRGRLTPVWERDADGDVLMRSATPPDSDTPVMRPVQARNEDGTLKWLTVRKPSDALLALLLKRRHGTERTELTGADGAALIPAVDETARAARLAQLLAFARSRRDDPDIRDLA